MGKNLPRPTFKLEEDERRARAVYPLSKTRRKSTKNFQARAVSG